jgi:hypothetical protein
MIFYHALDEQGHLHILGTQADARAINKRFTQVDIPTDKAGLQAELQRLYAYIDELKDKIGGSAPAEAPEEEPSEGEAAPAAEPAVQSPPVHPEDELPDEDADLFDAQVLEQQVDALGMLGAEALERFDGWTEITGISAAFARGVALLNVIASDQHQLARVFLRDRLKKRKRFGA